VKANNNAEATRLKALMAKTAPDGLSELIASQSARQPSDPHGWSCCKVVDKEDVEVVDGKVSLITTSSQWCCVAPCPIAPGDRLTFDESGLTWCMVPEIQKGMKQPTHVAWGTLTDFDARSKRATYTYQEWMQMPTKEGSIFESTKWFEYPDPETMVIDGSAAGAEARAVGSILFGRRVGDPSSYKSDVLESWKHVQGPP